MIRWGQLFFAIVFTAMTAWAAAYKDPFGIVAGLLFVSISSRRVFPPDPKGDVE